MNIKLLACYKAIPALVKLIQQRCTVEVLDSSHVQMCEGLHT